MVTNIINTKYKKQMQCAKEAIISSVKNTNNTGHRNGN